ncbi:adenylosuccinate lyase [Campylobacter curvus]|uniref:adenylosuccinate lyase n=1 Tax=Campylobacter curvus TaxID=200 RepID=UPI00147068A7|nr:adenylosuccinate lyase [Campylobacter curvus]
MNITHTLESLSIQTDDDALFCELRDLINKNFSKTLANKGKIISFYEENEMPQRRCFLKFIKRLYEKQNSDELDIKFAEYKTIKLGYAPKNALANLLSIDVNFIKDEVNFSLNSAPKVFASYILQSFKDNANSVDEKTNTLHIKIKNESDFNVLSMLFSRREHLKFIVDFNFDEAKFQNFKRNFKVQNSSKFINRFSALATLLEENFEILGCEKSDGFEQIRENYLALVKIYHPDRHDNKPENIKNEYRKKFEKIQNAYESLKPFFKTQEAFVKVG